MTSIEWVRNPDNETQGITVNSKTGCLNHENGLCKGGGFPCYAYKLAHERLKSIYLTNPNTIASQIINDTPLNMMQKQVKAELDPFYPRFWKDRLAAVHKITKPTGIFLDDMSDWMGEYWPREWTWMELQIMRDCPQHRFYTLTKQPQQLINWSPFPDNAWVGVTATTWLKFSNALGYLAAIKAKVKYLSFEPLLEQIQMDMLQKMLFPKVINWLIIGAWTGSIEDKYRFRDKYPDLQAMEYGHKITLQPKIEWVREIVEAADRAGVKVFLKDNLRSLLDSSDMKQYEELWQHKEPRVLEFPLRLRQEMPKK